MVVVLELFAAALIGLEAVIKASLGMGVDLIEIALRWGLAMLLLAAALEIISEHNLRKAEKEDEDGGCPACGSPMVEFEVHFKTFPDGTTQELGANEFVCKACGYKEHLLK